MSSQLVYLKRRFYPAILNPKVNKAESVSALKEKVSFPELCMLSDEATQSYKSVTKFIYGNALPLSYEELGKADYIPYSSELEKEVNWTILALRRYKTEIQLFLTYRSAFEDNFLLGKYDEAEKYLKKIEDEVCCSIWTLESRMLLLEFHKSPEENKKFSSYISSLNKGFFTPYLAHYFSNKAEKNFSVLKYDLDVQNSLSKLKGDLAEANKQYYYFKLNFIAYSYSEFKQILAFEANNSVIDRYLTLVEVFKLIVTTREVTIGFKKFILNRITYLLKKFDDPELSCLLLAIDPSIKAPKDVSFHLRTVDLYTSGFYSEAIDDLIALLRKYPSRFEYYILYVKCFLYQKQKFVLPSDSECFQNVILTEVYRHLSKVVEPHLRAIQTSRILKNLSPFKISKGINNFYNAEFLRNSYWDKYNHLSYSYDNPLFANNYREAKSRQLFLSNLKSRYNHSITLDLYTNKTKDDFDQYYKKLNIPEQRKNVELAKFYQERNDFVRAISLLEQLLEESNEMIPIYETCIKNLFHCYLLTLQLDKAIKLYVDSYFMNEFIVHEIDCKLLHSKIRASKFKSVTPTIDLPLFYGLSYAEENEVHTAYERFNLALGVERPSQIAQLQHSLEDHKLILFLRQICTPEIFKHSIFINGSKERYSERIVICQQLLQIDSANSKIYNEELTTITDKLIIQEGLQQLDESKIYVNEQGLITSELKEYEGLYNRYKTISKIFNESRVFLLDMHRGEVRSLNKQGGESNSISKFSLHPVKDIFKEIFDIITEKFLHSKFGIAAYLSTRIRHGVLLGEVRPVFEKYHLIGQKDQSTQSYRAVEYWNKRYSFLESSQLDELQLAIAVLSERVDNLIQKLIKNNLQIKTDKDNHEGWFDYTLEEEKLLYHAIRLISSKDYTEFVKGVVELLWQRTDSNLERIRTKFQSVVKNDFNDMLSDFNNDLHIKFHRQAIPEVYTNINTCSTEVQNALDRIASWFNRSGSQTSDFKLDKLVNIVLENINKRYLTRRIELTKSIQTTLTFKGEYYTHFADLFRIFLENVLIHSNQDISVIPTEVIVDEMNSQIEVQIKNEYPVLENLDTIKNNEGVIDLKKLSTENKSGIHKANKILRSDLKDDTNKSFFSIDDQARFCVLFSIRIDQLKV